ncbi:receptor activity-modifying protein 1-like [Hippocampus zosterae]|uniref:receptor activity-modifying protein 1-like n=1 Tax=Hippocampus zosterae TaxID=109293 RepID=UPI00223E26E6|nr:receptor activity-modifying protein 1-like [Hippocampus zosterae]
MRTLTSRTLALVFFWTVFSHSPGSSQTTIHPCDKRTFENNVHICRSAFNQSMETSGYRRGCAWPAVKRVYYDLKLCVDHWAAASLCQSRGSLVDDLFREVHGKYFASCGQVRDPAVGGLVALIAPVVLATVLMPFLLVKLATWNTGIDVRPVG